MAMHTGPTKEGAKNGRGVAANDDEVGSDIDSLDTGPGSSAQLQAVRRAVAKEKGTEVTEEDGFAMPALTDIIGETTVAKELKPDRLKRAYEAAKDIDLENPLSTVEWGLEEQKKASTVTREFFGHIEAANIEQLTDMALDQNNRMEQLKFGELKQNWFSKLVSAALPGKQADKVQKFLAKRRELSDLMDEAETAYADEKLKLSELQERMRTKIEENQGVYDTLSERVAAMELSYAARKKEVAEYKKQHAESTDAAEIRRISLMDTALAMQARRINALKATRMETLTALNTMDLQVQRITAAIAMIDEQSTFNRQVWDNTVLMAATDKQMKGSVQVVQYNRKSIERMLKERQGDISQTIRDQLGEQKQGVVNAAVLEYAAMQVVRMNEMVIKGNKEIRDEMGKADQIIKRLDGMIKEVAKTAAAMSEGDVAALDEYLKENKVPVPESEAQAEEIKKKKK